VSDDPGELIPYDLTGQPRYFVEWPAGLPHEPIWNLMPRHKQRRPYLCCWHGVVDGDRCEACHAEHAEYLETGAGEPRFNSYEEARAAVRAAEERFAAALPGRTEEIAGGINAALAGVLPEGVRFEWTTAGTLTPEGVGRALDELWTPARRGERPFAGGGFEVSGTIAVDFYPGAFEALMEAIRPKCGALLFPPPPGAPRPMEPVHPLDAPYFAPVQGPQPAACALNKDHLIGWHWDGRGTWFR
jgi:hypothetical protein